MYNNNNLLFNNVLLNVLFLCVSLSTDSTPAQSTIGIGCTRFTTRCSSNVGLQNKQQTVCEDAFARTDLMEERSIPSTRARMDDTLVLDCCQNDLDYVLSAFFLSHDESERLEDDG